MSDAPTEQPIRALVPATEERKHHPYSPSQLQSLEACPCYQSKSSEHVRTVIGTIAHNVTETRVDDNRLDDDDAGAAAECLDFYDRRKMILESRRAEAVKSLAAELWGKDCSQEHCADAEKIANSKVPGIYELKETYLPVDDCAFDDPIHGRVECTTAGFVDRALIWGTEAELFDWKFGMWPVEDAKNNLQGVAYTLGLFRKYVDLDKITFFFKQPLINSLTSATFYRRDVAALYLRVSVVVARARVARAAAAKGDWSSANPMIPACNFCANLGKCHKVAAIACHVGKKFYPVSLPDDLSPTKIMSPDQARLRLQLGDLMKIWGGACRSQTTDQVLRRDAEVPNGYKLTSSSRRELLDPAKFKEQALQYLTKEELDSTLEVSFGKVEEKIKDKSPRGQKKATLEMFQAALIESGAVQEGQPFAFLRATSEKSPEESTNKQT